NTYIIEGDLTIREMTMPVVLTAEFGGIVSIDNVKKAGFTAKGKINRFKYGLKWDDLLDNGGLIVGEEVDLVLKVELIKK
ncbi:MAG: YceI family protein, partial [Bacteroidota bacterium]